MLIEMVLKVLGEDIWIHTVCNMCYNGCGIRAHRVDGVIVRIEGDPDCPLNRGKLCAKGNAGLLTLYNPQRIRTPLKRTNPRKGIGVDPGWEEISESEALDMITEKLRKAREYDPRSLLWFTFDLWDVPFQEAFLFAFGSAHGWAGSAGFYCGQGLHPIAYLTTGSFFIEPDFKYCNYLVLVGTQNGFIVNHLPTRAALEMANARDRGMKLVVVDPICTNAASKADEWVPIRPGTDVAFLLSIATVLLNEIGIYDADFLRRHTNAPYLIGSDGYYVRDRKTGDPLIWDPVDDRAKPHNDPTTRDSSILGAYEVVGQECRPAFDVLKENVNKYSPEKATEITTVPAGTIRRIAREFGENARIGSTITIDGKSLPYRPAHIDWYRGMSQHLNGWWNGWCCQLLNILVGAIDVPGGHLGATPVGPTWGPRLGPDGLLVPTNNRFAHITMDPYPARRVIKPQSLNLFELFPVAFDTEPLYVEGILNSEKYGLPYTAQALMVGRTNIIANTYNPEIMAKMVMKIPFVAFYGFNLDETGEFADVVLPETHHLERWQVFTNPPWEFHPAGEGMWFWMVRQPVADPPPGVKPGVHYMIELAERLGILPEFNTLLNLLLTLGPDPELKLDPDKRYTYLEIYDRWLKSICGVEYSLEYFKINNTNHMISRKKKVEEAYPRPFLKPRIPIYLEHLKAAGEEVKNVVSELGIEWNTSGYQPLPEWIPCFGYHIKQPEYDLFPVNYKLPILNYSFSHENPWLEGVTEAIPHGYTILVNNQTARNKGIKDGDTILLETGEGHKVKGVAKVTELVHPEVLGIAGVLGRWARWAGGARGKGVHWNTLMHFDMDHIDTVSAGFDACVRVKVTRI